MVYVSVNERFAHQPGIVLTIAALVFATVTVGLAGWRSTPALAAGAVGILGLTIGLTRRNRRFTAISAVGLLASVLVAGATGAPPRHVLPAAATALLAGEFGREVFAMTDELPGGTVERAEGLHVATATGAGAVVTGITYALYQTLEFGISPIGVVLVLIAVVALGVALKE